MKNILISGDSWGCGEWMFVDRILTNSHKGLHYFLEYGLYDNNNESLKKIKNIVENVSKPAGNLISTLECIGRNNNLSSFDYIIVFVTDYLRDVRNHKGYVDFDKVKSKKELVNLYNEIEDNFLESLSKINNKNIILLGGLSKVNTNKLIKYDNIYSPIPSIIEFIRPGIQQHDILVENFLKNLPDNIDSNYLDFIQEQWDMWMNIKTDIYFLFDGEHPDRNAHLLIYKKLKSILNL